MCTTRTSREIRSRSTSLSSGKDSTAISMARWVDASISDGSGGQVEKEGRNQVVVLSWGDIHHSGAITVCQPKDIGSLRCGAPGIAWGKKSIRTPCLSVGLFHGDLFHGRLFHGGPFCVGLTKKTTRGTSVCDTSLCIFLGVTCGAVSQKQYQQKGCRAGRGELVQYGRDLRP